MAFGLFIKESALGKKFVLENRSILVFTPFDTQIEAKFTEKTFCGNGALQCTMLHFSILHSFFGLSIFIFLATG